MNRELEYYHVYDGDAWQIDYKDWFVDSSGNCFNTEDAFYWGSDTDNKLVKVEVFMVESCVDSICEIDFSEQEPHVYVTMFSHAENGELVKSWFEGKLLKDESSHPDIPFSTPVVYSPIRRNVRPKVFVPGVWGGSMGYQDTVIELPLVDDQIVFISAK